MTSVHFKCLREQYIAHELRGWGGLR